MPEIGFIAPTPQIYDSARRMIDRMEIGSKVLLRQGHLDEGVAVAREMQDRGVDVLVSRGGVAGRILAARDVTTPLVEIDISAQDLAQAIGECRRVSGREKPQIAMIPFHGVRDDLLALAPFFTFSIHCYPRATSPEKMEELVHQAISEGADAVIGGASTRIAEKHGLPAVLIASGDVSLQKALAEAFKVAYARKLEKERAQRLKVIVDLSHDGIVSLDGDGCIQVFNPTASRLLRTSGPLAGRSFGDLFPGLDIAACLDRGKCVSQVLNGRDGTPLMVNARPIHVGRDVAGAVVTMQETRYISDLENRIRKDLYTKGLVATYRFEDILGQSPQIDSCRRIARQYAATTSTVLISGETGTGKELFAQSIHNAGPRGQGPFVAVNCAALPPSLLESELFGYVEGAFTGAARKGKPGLFELAQGGTIFLDEISEMDRYAQARLLRILQERCIMRLGGGSYVPLDVRVLVASNRNLGDMVASGEFRRDLYYRINLLHLTLPPLRERAGDVIHLAQHFAALCQRKYGKPPPVFSDRALARLAQHSWPGNVRELQNVVERICLSSEALVQDEEDVDAALDMRDRPAPRVVPRAERPARDPDSAERQRVVEALQRAKGNQKLAAALLGIDRGTLSRRMKRLDIRKILAF